ncbi:MAG: O-antigen ligase family protein [Gallionella sp.]|nr:O-antigen ligase family protein [Gallionella sp.]
MKIKHSYYFHFVEKAAALLLLAYPVLMLTVKGGMNAVFLFMLLLALTVWMVRPAGMSAVAWKPEWTVYVAAMFLLSFAILASQMAHQNITAHPHDAASRYWLAIPIFLLLQRLPLRVIGMLQYAFPLGAIGGLLMATKEPAGRLAIATLDKIHFGDFELILGMLSLFSLNWLGRDIPALRLLKILGCIAGVWASLASGSRGGWLAIPLFIELFFYFSMGKVSLKMITSSLLAATLVMTASYFAVGTFHQRVNALAHDVVTFDQGNRDTSIGVRWQLYQTAADVFYRHPFTGVGPEGFASEMQPMVEAGKITSAAAQLGRGEVHNEILAKAAGMGILGLIAILAGYLVPLQLFWRATQSGSDRVRRSGILGVVFVSGVFVFGLTVEFLNLTMATAFYSFTVAVLLAACYNVHHGEPFAKP